MPKRKVIIKMLMHKNNTILMYGKAVEDFEHKTKIGS